MATPDTNVLAETAGRTGAGVDAHATTLPPPSGRVHQKPPTRAEVSLARGLGWFSIGLGLAEVLMPDVVARLAGVRRRPALFRLLGLRELASGLAIFQRRRPAGALWSRVIGDAIDLSLLGAALNSPCSDRSRVTTATAAVLGVTALDIAAASRMTVRRPRLRSVRVVKSVAVNRTPMECYVYWRDLENLPSFMEQVLDVRAKDERRSRWVVRGPAGREVEWDAEITRDEPGSMISWRSLGGEVRTHGTVLFASRPGGRGTIVRVALEYAPPAGALGAMVARLFVVAPEQQVKADLRRFKQVLETGEVPTTEGQPHGRRGRLYKAVARYVTGGES